MTHYLFNLLKLKCFFSRYDHPHILAGQGTMGLEIVEQVPDVDAVVIPVGGGGLIAGTALAIKSLFPHVQVIVSTQVLVNTVVPLLVATLNKSHPL